MEKDRNVIKLITEIRKFLISENKIASIITEKIGLPSEIAEWIMTSFPEKFQLFFANNFKKEAIKRIAGNKPVIAIAMEKILKGDRTQPSLRKQLLRQKDYLDGVFRYILGYLQNRRELAIETDELNLREMSLEQMIARADAWHEEVKKLKAGAIVDESGKIIKTYPDGHYWINLGKSFCSSEAKTMGHCGQGSSNGTLYSFRKNKHPFLRGDISNGRLIQLRGRANSKPKEEYHPYIMDFLLDPKVGITSLSPSLYRPESNLELKDFSVDKLITLYQAKPKLFGFEELYKTLRKYPQFAAEVNFRETPLHQDHKEELIRRHPEMQDLLNR